MPDMEKVIKGLETIRFNLRQMNHGLLADFCDEALALLKEQETVEPKAIGMNAFGHPVYACGKCGLLITESMNYCHECGKRIIWEGR